MKGIENRVITLGRCADSGKFLFSFVFIWEMVEHV